jgi:hypothetical protein
MVSQVNLYSVGAGSFKRLLHFELFVIDLSITIRRFALTPSMFSPCLHVLFAFRPFAFISPRFQRPLLSASACKNLLIHKPVFLKALCSYALRL